MPNYKVSILIPVYNSEKYIQKCARTVFAQTLKEVEYVFVDDGSTDSGIDLLLQEIQKFPERFNDICIIRHERNRGISAARQTAFDRASGEYILAMDSDDYIEPEMLEQLYNEALVSGADIVFCDFVSETENKSIRKNFSFSPSKNKLIEVAIRGESALWNKLFRRNLLTSYNIKTLDGIDHGDDLAVLVKLLFHAEKFSYLPVPFYHYIESNCQSTTKAFKPKHIDDRINLVNEVVEYLKKEEKTYQYEILLMKALRKAKILLLTNGEKQYIGLYNEINPYIFKLKVTTYTRIILILSNISIPSILKIYLWLLKKAGK